MTPLQSYLLAILADHRAWNEATRAALTAHGLPTDFLDETLMEIVALQREITGAALDS